MLSMKRSVVDDCHHSRIRSSLNADSRFDDNSVGKAAGGLERIFSASLKMKLQENMDMCPGCRNITAITLKTALNTKQSIK